MTKNYLFETIKGKVVCINCRSFQTQGDSRKPLVVFFPGWAHLGRISYGFPGCNKEHFLAHWLTENGYSFFATSYPVDHPVYDRVYPEFSLTDWGKMGSVSGNHFMFLGKSGAQKTAGYVEYFDKEVHTIKQELTAVYIVCAQRIGSCSINSRT